MLRAYLMPNSYTFPSVLTACCILKDMQMGKVVHGCVVKCCATDIFVKTAIVDFYAKFRCMDEAFREFSHMSVHNVVSWTAIISGFVLDNDIFSALKLFNDMRQIGEEINSYTLTSVLSACAKPGMIDLAVQIHSLILKLGFYLYLNVGAALINMYAKMGEVELSELAFNEMENKKDQGTWAAILSSFAQWVESAVSTSNSLTPSPSFSSSSTATISKKQNNKEKEKPIKIQHFHYSDLEAATNGFSERKLLGKGSHGYVYKAVMVSSSSFASAPEFIISNNEVDNEIDILSKIQSNNSKLPNWGRRVRLALQTAKEIDTLHSSTPLVIHRNQQMF
ncbi:Pentatricopeptide repeat-containing protein [Arachis hypogaea]|nr:Pentatricopeptide repeat-containing protein [Arachis hypogaea]